MMTIKCCDNPQSDFSHFDAMRSRQTLAKRSQDNLILQNGNVPLACLLVDAHLPIAARRQLKAVL